MKKKSVLALTLGLGLMVGNLAGTNAIAQANQKPAEIHITKVDNETTKYNKEAHQEILKLLQIDEQTFQQEQSSGKSLGEIVAVHNVSKQAVADLIAKQMTQEIDRGVKEKNITLERADEMKNSVVADAQKIVDIKSSEVSNGNDKQNLQQMLTLLQIDEQTFKQEQSSGKSLAEIAESHKVPRQAVGDLVAKQMSEDIDKGVMEKRITVAQSNEMKSHVVEDTQKAVDAKNSAVGNVNDKQNLQEMLTLLQIDEQTFKQEQSSGKSLLEIAEAHKIPRQNVVDLVVKHMTQQVDTGVAEKRITVEQANEMKSNIVEEAQKMVDQKGVEIKGNEKPQK